MAKEKFPFDDRQNFKGIHAPAVKVGFLEK
jgi:hypothetical protein